MCTVNKFNSTGFLFIIHRDCGGTRRWRQLGGKWISAFLSEENCNYHWKLHRELQLEWTMVSWVWGVPPATVLSHLGSEMTVWNLNWYKVTEQLLPRDLWLQTCDQKTFTVSYFPMHFTQPASAKSFSICCCKIKNRGYSWKMSSDLGRGKLKPFIIMST